jgi:hypothetical protein
MARDLGISEQPIYSRRGEINHHLLRRNAGG